MNAIQPARVLANLGLVRPIQSLLLFRPCPRLSAPVRPES